jgi:FkbM family methyltransferase
MNKIVLLVNRLLSIYIERKFKIISIKPTYKIVDRLNENSIVVDIGTGEDADFSQNLIKKYQLNAYGFDPTRKHHSSLDSVVEKSNGHFTYYKYAVSNRTSTKTFFESLKNRSGSFFDDHVNIKNDATLSYSVKTISIDSIFDILKIGRIDVLKMDIEGEEYSVLSSLPISILKAIDQLIVEFHHDTITRFKFKHTEDTIKILKTAGFIYHTVDNVNYLFFRNNVTS